MQVGARWPIAILQRRRTPSATNGVQVVKGSTCDRVFAMESMHPIRAVVGCRNPLRKYLGHGANDRVHHRGDHVARRTQRSVFACRDEGALGNHNVQSPKITLVHGLIGREEVFHGHPGSCHRPPIAPGVEWAGALGRDFRKINRELVTELFHGDVDRHRAVEVDAIVVQERAGLVNAIGRRFQNRPHGLV